MTKLNIVTVTYNDCRNLSKTLESIREHKTDLINYYVIDGFSTDDTPMLLKKNSDIIDGFISEPDLGIYDAMNKALRFPLRKSDFLIWINAGDLLAEINGVNFDKFQAYSCGFFSVRIALNSSEPYELSEPNIILPYNEKNFFPKSWFLHQGFVIKVETFEEHMYDIKVGIQAENLLMSTCILKGDFFTSKSIISYFHLDGVSSKYFWKVLISYLKVAKSLNFNLLKTIYYKRLFLAKQFIKAFLPYSVFSLMRKINHNA